MPADGRLSLTQYTWRFAAGSAATGAALGGTAASTAMTLVPAAASAATSVVVAPVVSTVVSLVTPSAGGVVARVASSATTTLLVETLRTGAVTTGAAAQTSMRWVGAGAGALLGAGAGSVAGLVTYPVYSYFYRPVPIQQAFNLILAHLENRGTVSQFINFLQTYPQIEQKVERPHLLPALKALADNPASYNQPVPSDLQSTLDQVVALSQTLKSDYLAQQNRSTWSILN